MTDTGQRLRDLHESGTLHRRLLLRVRMMSAIGAVLLGIALYDSVRDHLSLLLAAVFILVGFGLGMTIFARMSKVVWDEEEETIASARMDVFGVLALVLYVAFDVGVRHYLSREFSTLPSVTGYVFAAIGGSLVGRSMGTRRAIYRALGKQEENALD